MIDDFDFLDNYGSGAGIYIDEVIPIEPEPIEVQQTKKEKTTKITTALNTTTEETSSQKKKRKKSIQELVLATVLEAKGHDFKKKHDSLFPAEKKESLKSNTIKPIWDQVKSLHWHKIAKRRQRKATESEGKNYIVNYDLVQFQRELIKNWYPLTSELSEDQRLSVLRSINQDDWNRIALNYFNEEISKKLIKEIARKEKEIELKNADKTEEEIQEQKENWKRLNSHRYEKVSYQALSEIPLPKKVKKGEKEDPNPFLQENKRILKIAEAKADKYLLETTNRYTDEENPVFDPVPVEMELGWSAVGIGTMTTILLELLGVKRNDIEEKSAIQVYVETSVPLTLLNNPVAIFAKLLWDHKTNKLDIFQEVSKKTLDQVIERYVPHQAINRFKQEYDRQNDELVIIGDELKVYVSTKINGRTISETKAFPKEVQEVFWKIYRDIEDNVRSLNVDSSVSTKELRSDFYRLYKLLSRLIECKHVTLSQVEVVLPSPRDNNLALHPLPVPIVTDRIKDLDYLKYASDPHPTGSWRRPPEKITLINIPAVLQKSITNIVTVLRPSDVENVICYVDWADLNQPLRNQLSQPNFDEFFQLVYPHDYHQYQLLQKECDQIYAKIKRQLPLKEGSTDQLKRELEEVKQKIEWILLPKKQAFQIHLDKLIKEGFSTKDLVFHKYGQISLRKGGLYFSLLNKSFLFAERYKLPGSGNAAVAVTVALRKWGIQRTEDYILGVGSDHKENLLALYDEYLKQEDPVAKKFVKDKLSQLCICPIGIDEDFHKYIGIELCEKFDPGTKSHRIYVKKDNRPIHYTNRSKAAKNSTTPAKKQLLVYAGLPTDLKKSWNEEKKKERELYLAQKAKTPEKK